MQHHTPLDLVPLCRMGEDGTRRRIVRPVAAIAEGLGQHLQGTSLEGP